ncbi:MAG: NADH-quinone oxidoreductase subunit N [candidate division Zixibacteria bacterium]|nr:NADH-quinone oxidoreductase subunit N [candidate division Zixibacteria bacterium]
MEFQLPEYSLRMMLPEIVLFLAALVVITFDVVTKRKSGTAVGYLAMGGLVLTAIVMATTGYGRGFGNMFIVNPLALFFKVIFIGAAFMAIGSSFGITQKKIVNHRGEFFGLIMFSTLGMMFLASSRELVSLYIGLELTTIPLFVLAGFFKDDKRSVEAGIKYLIVGAFSSALLLYGISFLYGLTGTTDLFQMQVGLATKQIATQGNMGAIMVVAIVTIVAGLGFKLALPPFHQWAPDVYEGAPTPVTAFLSVGSKAAGLVAFVKVVVIGLYSFYEPLMKPNDWGIMVGVLAAVATILGNTVAIRQTNIKRMLAYSSIAHVGYMMIGLLAMNELGLSSVAFYMFAYLFTNMGAFAIVTLVEERTGSCDISDYNGLARSAPFVSLSLAIFLLSLTGVPPLAGFVGKFYIFAAALKQAGSQAGQDWLYWLVGVGILTTVFALYYYANVIKMMYFGKREDPPKITLNPPAVAVVVIGLVGVILFGLYPAPIIEFASNIPLSYGFIVP